jgi:predicted enzyme related to lactoylglutathione lyase
MRLDLVMIHVDGMDRMSAFVSSILALEPTYASASFSAWELENTRLCLHAAPGDGHAEGSGPGRVIPCLQTEDLDAMTSRVEGAGGTIIGPPHQTPRGPVLDFFDPEGNPWQAIQIK